MADVKYLTSEAQDLTPSQAGDWLDIGQDIFGSIVTAASTKEFMFTRILLSKDMNAVIKLEFSGTADEYVLDIPATLINYDGITAVWQDTRAKQTTVTQVIKNLVIDVHPTVPIAQATKLILTRGSPNTSKIEYTDIATAHDWTVAVDAGTPLGTLIEIIP